MAGSNFEKNIQQELTGLKLEPDSYIWDNIASELRKEKKRRWLVWLWLLFGLAGAGSFLLYNGSDKLPVSSILKNNPTVATNTIKNNSMFTPIHQAVIRNRKSNKNYNNSETKNDDSNQPEIPIAGIDTLQKPSLTNLLISPPLSSQLITKSETNNAVSPTIDIAIITTTPTLLTTKDSANPSIAETKKKRINNEWQWYACLDLGISGTSGGLFKGLPALQTASFNNALAGATTFPATNYTPLQSNRVSFGMNTQAEKPIGKNYFLGLSLGYYQITSAVGIGKRVDSNAIVNNSGFYYQNNNDRFYTNHYHFLQAGINLTRQFRFSPTLSLRWQLGTGLGWLFSSNALQYAAAQNILVQGNSTLSSLQGNLSTGLAIGIGIQQRYHVGPQLLYYFTPVSNLDGEKNTHLFSIGVEASVRLSKNKK